MKIEFENSIRRLSFLCRLTGIKIAWLNPCQGKIFSFFKLGARRCVSSHPKISEKYFFFFHKNMQKIFQVGFFSFLGLGLEIGPSSCSIHYWHVPSNLLLKYSLTYFTDPANLWYSKMLKIQ